MCHIVRIHKSLLVELFKNININLTKLGGSWKILHGYEKMLNYKIKSHLGSAPLHRKDSIWFSECVRKQVWFIKFGRINGQKSFRDTNRYHYLPCCFHSIDHTDEHKWYSKLYWPKYVHHTACHKYKFI